jgi:hypothetical protein
MALPTGHHYGESHGDAGANMGGHHHSHEVPDPDTIEFDKAGIGDPVLRGDCSLVRPSELGVEIAGFAAVKAPIASETSGFGTGAWDFGGGVTLARTFPHSVTSLELGYWWLGSLETIELLDPVTARLSYSRSIGSGDSAVGGYLRGSTAAVSDTEAPVEAAAFLSHRLRSGAVIDLDLAIGLTATAPDVALQLGWRWAL